MFAGLGCDWLRSHTAAHLLLDTATGGTLLNVSGSLLLLVGKSGVRDAGIFAARATDTANRKQTKSPACLANDSHP